MPTKPELLDHAARVARDPTVRRASRWLVGMAIALLLSVYGYALVVLSPTRSVAYRAFGGLPRLIHGDYDLGMVLVAPSRGASRPRWFWFLLVGWWLGWMAVLFVGWPLLALPATTGAALRLFGSLDRILFLPKERRRSTVVSMTALTGGKGGAVTMPLREPIPAGVRFAVLQRDGFRCQYCGRSPTEDATVRLHIDHRRPVARGGSNDKANLVTACATCNMGKGARFDTSAAVG